MPKLQMTRVNISYLGNSTLEVLYLCGKFLLFSCYMKHTTSPYSFDRYTTWMRSEVKSQTLLFLNQLVFGCLEGYFQFKLGVKCSDSDLLMAGLLEAEKIFFFNKSNKNYQQASAYRVSDLIKMPSKMSRLKIVNQTTDATAQNSVDVTEDRLGNFTFLWLLHLTHFTLRFRSNGGRHRKEFSRVLCHETHGP